MKRMFPKYDGAIVDPEHFDDEVEYICTLMSKITNKKEYARILQYVTNIENITELKDKTGKNLLMCACDINNLNLINYFLRRGIDINSVDNDNDNILYYLDYSLDNALEILDFLIENGVNVFHKNNTGVDIFIFLNYINNITPIKNVSDSIQYLLNWYGKTYVRNNFIKDPNFVTNVKSVALFGDVFIETILQFIDIHIIPTLQKLQTDIDSLLKKFSKKDASTLKTNLEKSSVIELLRYRMPSELTEKLIDNLIIKEGEDFKRKMLTALVLCRQLLEIAENKRKEIDFILKSKESKIAEASLLRDIDEEERKRKEKEDKEKHSEENERLKREKKKEKERLKKKKKRDEEFEKQSIPKELKLMGKEDKDTSSYDELKSYILAENRIEELLSEILVLKERVPMDKPTRRQLQSVIFKRIVERNRRINLIRELKEVLELRKKRILIYIVDEDIEDAKRFEQEELQRELEKDDDILLILEKIYAQQERVLNNKT